MISCKSPDASIFALRLPGPTPAKSAAERATEEPAPAAAKVPVAVSPGEKMIDMSKHGPSPVLFKNISHDISKVKNCFTEIRSLGYVVGAFLQGCALRRRLIDSVRRYARTLQRLPRSVGATGLISDAA